MENKPSAFKELRLRYTQWFKWYALAGGSLSLARCEAWRAESGSEVLG